MSFLRVRNTLRDVVASAATATAKQQLYGVRRAVFQLATTSVVGLPFSSQIHLKLIGRGSDIHPTCH
jgi:hypothetical protein